MRRHGLPNFSRTFHIRELSTVGRAKDADGAFTLVIVDDVLIGRREEGDDVEHTFGHFADQRTDHFTVAKLEYLQATASRSVETVPAIGGYLSAPFRNRRMDLRRNEHHDTLRSCDVQQRTFRSLIFITTPLSLSIKPMRCGCFGMGTMEVMSLYAG